jgi:uncharacterized membrane protein
MSDAREDVLHWMRAGHVPPARAREALAVVQATPSAAAWRSFLERALVLFAAIAFVAALGFFIAANWSVLGRFGKLALIEAAIVAAAAVALWRGLDSTLGRAGVLAACIATGTLLAFVGQTYQTGADTWELFAAWAAAIVAWVAVSRQPATWVLWIAIVDVGAWLYFASLASVAGLVFGERSALWAMLGVHAIAAVTWEIARHRGVDWTNVNWAPRLVAVVALGVVTLLAMDAILANRREAPGWLALGVYGATLAAVYYAWRLRRTDLLLLSAAALSMIVVVVAAIARADPFDSAAGLLVIGLVIVGLAGLAATWLRSVARETRALAETSVRP